jgi:chemotaxis signal transduction protein
LPREESVSAPNAPPRSTGPVAEKPPKPAVASPAENKPTPNRPTENKPAENRPAENRPAENRPTENKPAQHKPAEPQPTQAKLAENRPAEKKAQEKRPESPAVENRAAPTATTPERRDPASSLSSVALSSGSGRDDSRRTGESRGDIGRRWHELAASAAANARSSASSSSSAETAKRPAQLRNLSVFWLAKRCFAVDTSIVREVVAVEQVAPVPRAAPGIRGLFNLRGLPVALVDLARVLSLKDVNPAAPARQDDARLGPKTAASSSLTALVLSMGDLLVGAQIERMEAIWAADRGVFVKSDSPEENPIVDGFFELTERKELVVTVLDTAVLTERFNALRAGRKTAERSADIA